MVGKSSSLFLGICTAAVRGQTKSMGRNDESQHSNSCHVQCHIRTITNLTVIWATTTNRVNIQGSHKVFTMGVGKGDTTMQLQGQMEQFSLSLFLIFPLLINFPTGFCLSQHLPQQSDYFKSSDLDAFVFVHKQKLKIYFQIQRCTKRVCLDRKLWIHG